MRKETGIIAVRRASAGIAIEPPACSDCGDAYTDLTACECCGVLFCACVVVVRGCGGRLCAPDAPTCDDCVPVAFGCRSCEPGGDVL